MHSFKQRRNVVATALSLVLSFAAGACSSDNTPERDSATPQSSDSAAQSSDSNTLRTVAESSTTVSEAESSVDPLPTESTSTPTTAPEMTIARKALLRPEDIGAGWTDYGAGSAFPMSSELAASLPSCSRFVDVVFDGNNGMWAQTAIGRNMDIAFTSVTVFPTEVEAAAMVAATALPEFDACWAQFNEVAIVKLPFGINSAKYESVEPPDLQIGGDSSSLHALEGKIRLGSTEVPDSCVCAFVQRGRTVVAFHSAAPVFTAAVRRDLIALAIARVDETIK